MVDHHEGLARQGQQARVVFGDAGQHSLGRLYRRCLAGAVQGQQLGGGAIGEVCGFHR